MWSKECRFSERGGDGIKRRVAQSAYRLFGWWVNIMHVVEQQTGASHTNSRLLLSAARMNKNEWKFFELLWTDSGVDFCLQIAFVQMKLGFDSIRFARCSWNRQSFFYDNSKNSLIFCSDLWFAVFWWPLKSNYVKTALQTARKWTRKTSWTSDETSFEIQ